MQAIVWHRQPAALTPSRRHAPAWHRRVRSRVVCWASADDPIGHASSDEVSSALRSLDSLLPGQQEDGEAGLSSSPTTPTNTFTSSNALQQLQPAGIYALDGRVRQPQGVRPIWSFILYYWNIVIFCASWYLDSAEGPGAGADFMEQLVNDHLAVLQQGDVLRLLSSPLVHPTPWSLFIALFALGTVGAELEASLGYVAFGALAACAVLCGGLADAVADTTPVTMGPLPLIAAVVGALCVTYARNALFDEDVAAARASLPTSIATPIDAPTAPGAEARQEGGVRDSGAPGGGSAGHEREEEADLEFLEGLLRIQLPTTPAGKALVAISTGVMAALEVLYDLEQQEGAAGSPAGAAVGLALGVVLALAAAPQYTVQRVRLSEAAAEVLREVPPWLPAGLPRERLKSRLMALTGRDAAVEGGAQRDPDVLLVSDTVSPWQRRAALAVMAAATAVFAGWALLV